MSKSTTPAPAPAVIYRVFVDYGGKATLAEVPVLKETEGRIVLGDRPRAFDYHKQINKSEVAIHRTPAEAIDGYLAEIDDQIKSLRGQIAILEKRRADAESLREAQSP